jgi:hypothetical protein
MIRLVCALLFTALMSVAFQAAADETADRPNYEDGDCWVFRSVTKNYSGQSSGEGAMPRDGEHRICFLESQFFVADGSERMPISIVSPWAAIVPIEKNRTLKFPIAIGRATKEEYRDNVRGTKRYQRVISEVHVVGIEEVKTPAGSFESFKIERDNMLGGGLGSKYLYFFSSQTKSIVKYHYEAVIGSSATWDVELVQYELAKSIVNK